MILKDVQVHEPGTFATDDNMERSQDLYDNALTSWLRQKENLCCIVLVILVSPLSKGQDFNNLNGSRVGEASHPGPSRMRCTFRKKC